MCIKPAVFKQANGKVIGKSSEVLILQKMQGGGGGHFNINTHTRTKTRINPLPLLNTLPQHGRLPGSPS